MVGACKRMQIGAYYDQRATERRRNDTSRERNTFGFSHEHDARFRSVFSRWLCIESQDQNEQTSTCSNSRKAGASLFIEI